MANSRWESTSRTSRLGRLTSCLLMSLCLLALAGCWEKEEKNEDKEQSSATEGATEADRKKTAGQIENLLNQSEKGQKEVLDSGWAMPLGRPLQVNAGGGWLATKADGYPDEGKTHLGLDLKASAGDEVYAIADGSIYGDYPDGYGYHVMYVQHTTAAGQPIVAVYGHVIPTRSSGTVKKGEPVATVGWHHLHFGIFVGELDPAKPPIAKDVSSAGEAGWGRMDSTRHASGFTNGLVDPQRFLQRYSPGKDRLELTITADSERPSVDARTAHSTPSARNPTPERPDKYDLFDQAIADYEGDLRVHPRTSLKHSTSELKPRNQTWIVVHGRRASRNSDYIKRLVNALNQQPEELVSQVITIDWSDIAGTPQLIGEFGIPAVANWNYLRLKEAGFTPSQINIIGHSWGALVANELAKKYREDSSASVNRLVALDPADSSSIFQAGEAPFDVNAHYCPVRS